MGFLVGFLIFAFLLSGIICVCGIISAERDAKKEAEQKEKEFIEMDSHSKTSHVQNIARAITKNGTFLPARIEIFTSWIDVWEGEWVYYSDSNSYRWFSHGGSHEKFYFIKDFNTDNIPTEKHKIVAGAIIRAIKKGEYKSEPGNWNCYELITPTSPPPPPPPERNKW